MKTFNYVKSTTKQKKSLLRKLDKKKVVVVGGGYIGIELVEAFALEGKEVTLVDGLDRILNKYLGTQNSLDILETDLRERGVNVRLNEMVKSYLKVKTVL